MRGTTHGTGQFSSPRRIHFTTGSLLAALVGKWQQYRMIRDAESLPYSVMKDIGFRAAGHTNAK
jgi:hypothetical protein